MTRERPKRPDPVEEQKRQNGLEEHEGIPHDPSEFDPLNPARQVDDGKGRRNDGNGEQETDDR